MTRSLVICLSLFAVTLAVYAPAGGFEFLNVDDPLYVADNEYVAEGLSWRSVRFALGDTMGNYWHPATTLAHLVVGEFFGVAPGPHHWVNAAMHAANGALIFLVLQNLTKATWRSAAVAALFAWHPLRVESAAWVTERATLLCMTALLAGVAAYAAYVRSRGWRAGLAYAAVAVCLFVGLTTKPVAMTFPCVLLLLDFWPLDRLSLLRRGDSDAPSDGQPGVARGVVRLVLEKIPLFAIVVALMVAAILQHAKVDVFEETTTAPLSARLGAAAVSYARYLRMTFWPVGLSPNYPQMYDWSPLQVALSVLLVGGITAWTVSRWRRQPYLPTGWLWFAGTLVPLLGVVQVRDSTIADRYLYVPHVGLFLAIVWGAVDVAPRTWAGRRGLVGLFALAAVASIVATSVQLRYWNDSITLFARAVEVNDANYVAHNQLGTALVAAGRDAEAVPHFAAAARIQPEFVAALNNLGAALSRQGRSAAALEPFAAVLRLTPRNADAHNNYANALMAAGRVDEAIRHYRAAVQIDEASAEAHHNLATALAASGQLDEAIRYDARAVELNPGYAPAYYSLGLAQAMAGGPPAEAIAHLRKAAVLQPDWADPHQRLAWLLATHADPRVRNGVEAVNHAEQAVRLTKPPSAEGLDTLATAYAEAGRFEDAVRSAEAALRLARAGGATRLARDVERRLAGYRSGQSVAMMRGSRTTSGPAAASSPATAATAPAGGS